MIFIICNFLLQCEGIMEEYEDEIIQHYVSGDDTDAYIKICRDATTLCQKERNAEGEGGPNEEL